MSSSLLERRKQMVYIPITHITDVNILSGPAILFLDVTAFSFYFCFIPWRLKKNWIFKKYIYIYLKISKVYTYINANNFRLMKNYKWG